MVDGDGLKLFLSKQAIKTILHSIELMDHIVWNTFAKNGQTYRVKLFPLSDKEPILQVILP